MSGAYLAALRLLARRELSEAQVRQRLARREHDAEAIDEAVARLKAERAIDDRRVAGIIARSETGLRHRGERRVLQKLQASGIAPELALEAARDTFAQLDVDALLGAALARRLAPGEAIADERAFSRLYRYLVAQGFEPDRVIRTLRARRTRA